MLFISFEFINRKRLDFDINIICFVNVDSSVNISAGVFSSSPNEYHELHWKHVKNRICSSFRIVYSDQRKTAQVS